MCETHIHVEIQLYNIESVFDLLKKIIRFLTCNMFMRPYKIRDKR